jgi:EmrB/QacA subfamily drug resistance transporter
MLPAMDIFDPTSVITASALRGRRRQRSAVPAAFPAVLVTTCLAVFLAQLDTSVVNLALKHIGSTLGADVTTLQWVVDGYNLAYAAFLLTGGALADMFGRRRLFITGIGLFTVGCLLCGTAPDSAVLIAGRAIAGLGAAFAMPASLAILSEAYPDPVAKARAISIWAGCNGLAWVIGPSLGGLIVDHAGWRWVFLLAVPVGLTASGLCIVAVPGIRRRSEADLDLPEQTLAVLGLAALSLACIEGPHWGWTSVATIAAATATAAALVAFVLVERRSAHPLVPLAIFRSRTFAAAAVAALSMTFGMYAMLFLMPLFLQTVAGASATMVGVAMLPVSLAFFLMSFGSGALATRCGARPVMASGLALMGLGLCALAALTRAADLFLIEPAFLAIGIGLGLNTGPLLSLAVSAVDKTQAGIAAGTINTARMVGATLGVAILGAVFAAHAGINPVDPDRIVAGLHPAFVGGALSELLGAFAVWWWTPRQALRVIPPAAPE